MKGDSQVIRLTDNAKEYLSSIANDDHITLGVKGGLHMSGIIRRTGLM